MPYIVQREDYHGANSDWYFVKVDEPAIGETYYHGQFVQTSAGRYQPAPGTTPTPHPVPYYGANGVDVPVESFGDPENGERGYMIQTEEYHGANSRWYYILVTHVEFGATFYRGKFRRVPNSEEYQPAPGTTPTAITKVGKVQNF